MCWVIYMNEIKEILDKGKLIIGTDVVMKKLKNNQLNKIFMAKNCSAPTKADLKKIAKMTSVEIVELDMENDELGTYCRKPFHIAVVGELKE